MYVLLNHDSPAGCTAAALIGAAANGHVEVLNFLILNVASLGQHIQVACDTACKMGQVDVIKYAVNTWNCGCSPSGLDDLARFGDTDIIDYLLQHDILPPQAYLLLASDLSDEDTISLDDSCPDEKHHKHTKVFNGSSYIDMEVTGASVFEFDTRGNADEAMSDSDDGLNADLYDDEDEDEDDGISDLDDDLEEEGVEDTVDRVRKSTNNLSDEEDEEEEDYDIDDEEDSFDRYIQKKKDTILTCLFDDSRDQNESMLNSTNPLNNTDETLLTMVLPHQLTRHVSTDTNAVLSHMGEWKSIDANSICIHDLDVFRQRSLAGDTRHFETFRMWSPVSWRESIENTMDSVVCNSDRMVMLPFLCEKFGGRVSRTGVERACEAGCLDILEWIYKAECRASSILPPPTTTTSSSDSSSDSSSRNTNNTDEGAHSITVSNSNSPSPSPSLGHDIFTPHAMEAACAGGQVEVARWLVNTVHLDPPTPAVAMTGSVKGSVSFLEWLHVTCGIAVHPDTCNLATSSGNCAALIWLHEFCQGQCNLTFNTNAVDLAAINGHMDVIIFLETIGIKSSPVAMDGALMNGHMEVYRHLAKSGGVFPSHYAVRYSALPWPSFSSPRLAPRFSSAVPRGGSQRQERWGETSTTDISAAAAAAMMHYG